VKYQILIGECNFRPDSRSCSRRTVSRSRGTSAYRRPSWRAGDFEVAGRIPNLDSSSYCRSPSLELLARRWAFVEQPQPAKGSSQTAVSARSPSG
jgi:hypothetical protein